MCLDRIPEFVSAPEFGASMPTSRARLSPTRRYFAMRFGACIGSWRGRASWSEYRITNIAVGIAIVKHVLFGFRVASGLWLWRWSDRTTQLYRVEIRRARDEIIQIELVVFHLTSTSWAIRALANRFRLVHIERIVWHFFYLVFISLNSICFLDNQNKFFLFYFKFERVLSF